ncbi:MAG: hypothetical protein KAT46_00800 [Deltaproteobacteria bacterium]|nr:hypothetical protein [Deltaproteobacteria bacterium]
MRSIKEFKVFLIAVVAFIGLTFGISSTANALVDLKVEGRYWYSTLEADAKVSDGSIIGTNINFVDDLGVDATNGFPELRAIIGLGSHKIRYSFIQLEWEGDETISQDINFAGFTYTATASVDTTFSVDMHSLGYEYDIIEVIGNKVGLIAELKYIDMNANLEASSLAGSDQKDSLLKFPLPTLGVVAQVGIPILFVNAEVTGISLGEKAYFVDADASINFIPLPLLTISGGYRLINIHVDYDDNVGNINIAGPYLALRFGF